MAGHAGKPGEPNANLAFEQLAAAIMERWAAERDPSVTRSEVAEARAYLERAGVVTIAIADDRFRLEATGEVLDAARVVLRGLQQVAARRAGRDSRR
jgi:hypothetical protein